ncbi:helix-turn-helix domain-containing protein [Streptomyces sp. NPDC102282]|uniref:helix-turn-helix domain-containing protein n=1 Tax=Streptomyces sp. NPDC102282 TaxID=3366154 RepID=UPI00382D492C
MARPESPIWAGASPENRALVLRLRELRAEKGVSYSVLAPRCHYSVATLSTAASGKKVPSWDVVKAFVLGCDPDADLAYWRDLWDTARLAGNPRTAPTPAPAAPAEPNRRERRRRQRHPDPLALDLPSESLAELLRTASISVPRAPRPGRDDTMRTALMLCTTPADFAGLLQDLRQRADMSIREISDLSRLHGLPISKSAVHDMTNGGKLPHTEQLHAYLLACGIDRDDTTMWHHTSTRLKISQIREAGRPESSRIRVAVNKLSGIGFESIMTTLMTLFVLLVQLSHMAEGLF